MDAGLLRILRATHTLRTPQRRLATFGETRIHYYLFSPLPPGGKRCRLREGEILAERPHILTAEVMLRRFEGFDEKTQILARELVEQYQHLLRGLEYRFRNAVRKTRLLEKEAGPMAQEVGRRLNEARELHAAVLVCPEQGWQISLLKLLLDEVTKSFPTQMRELEEHDLFNPAQAASNRRRAEVEALLRRLSMEKTVSGCSSGLKEEYQEKLKFLGKKLKDYGLFEEYEDRFFSLASSSSGS
ncbi:MAG: hypothetical protein HY402_03780 [Elusimicrobia bacterium]|nr:hypothetical protein [Elusimicrobiota bacterium]